MKHLTTILFAPQTVAILAVTNLILSAAVYIMVAGL